MKNIISCDPFKRALSLLKSIPAKRGFFHGLSSVALIFLALYGCTQENQSASEIIVPVSGLVNSATNNHVSPDEDMVLIRGRCFQMGSPTDETTRDPDERQHKACVLNFLMDKYEVTNAEFAAFLNAVGSAAVGNDWLRTADQNNLKINSLISVSGGIFSAKSGYENHPAVEVSWRGATAYALWLSDKKGATYRLPTEAEWEYAGRGGTETYFYWGNDQFSKEVCEYANFNSESITDCHDQIMLTSAVGTFKPNAYGLYDMAGNVWEWTCSEYDADYGGGELVCGDDAGNNARRVARGGSMVDNNWVLRSASRSAYMPASMSHNRGFRLIRII